MNIQLFHFNKNESPQRVQELEALGYEVDSRLPNDGIYPVKYILTFENVPFQQNFTTNYAKAHGTNFDEFTRIKILLQESRKMVNSICRLSI